MNAALKRTARNLVARIFLPRLLPEEDHFQILESRKLETTVSVESYIVRFVI